MKFIITTCIFSQSQKPRAAPNVAEFLQENEILITPSTLIDIELGIARAAEADPSRAAMLREWLRSERLRYGVVVEQGEAFQKNLAKLIACKPIQGLWTCTPTAKQFAFRQTLWVAAAALSAELPIATKSVRSYGDIDQHIPLPGIYNPVEMIWHVRKAPARNRFRSIDRMADVGLPPPAIPTHN